MKLEPASLLILTVGLGCLVFTVPSCGDGGDAADAPIISEPSRTAVQDRALRSLLSSAGESRLCDALVGRFVGLQDPDAATGPSAGLAPAMGRLHVETCRAERRSGGDLALQLGGRGWTWADESRAGPLGSRFAVRGYLRFRVTVDLVGALDLGYSEESRVLSIWYSPTTTPSAQMTLQGEVPVRAQGGWSGIIGTVGQILGGPLPQQASPSVAELGAAQVSRRLGQGITATVDLCTSQPDVVVGAMSNGQTARRPYPPDGTLWLANERVAINRGGLDIAGPWTVGDDGLRVDMESESGPGFEARLMCQAQALRVFDAFFNGRPASVMEELRRLQVASGRTGAVQLDSSSCPVMLLLTPDPQASAQTELRYRVVEPGHRVTGLLSCDG